jgi:hypothetical protein
MKKFVIAMSALIAASLFGSPAAKAQPQPMPYVIMVCNINGQLYNIDQNYGIYGLNGYYLGQLVAASSPSGWVAIRTDGTTFPVFGCR